MKELIVRAASGAVFVALVLGAATVGPFATAVLFLGVCVIGTIELHRLIRPSLSATALVTVAVVVYAVVAAIPLVIKGPPSVSIVLLHGVLLLLVLYFLQPLARHPIACSLVAFAYLAVPFAFATWLAAIEPRLFIGFMLLLWANDTGAYLVGKAIGKRKLMPAVSPGKTWEGFIGGVGIAILLAWPISGLSTAMPLQGWLIAAAAVAFTGTVGDLYESALKRRAGVKDSGSIMPGHGGVLDRFDGYLLAAPTMLLVVLLFS